MATQASGRGCGDRVDSAPEIGCVLPARELAGLPTRNRAKPAKPAGGHNQSRDCATTLAHKVCYCSTKHTYITDVEAGLPKLFVSLGP
jgi:hypothetical protein